MNKKLAKVVVKAMDKKAELEEIEIEMSIQIDPKTKEYDVYLGMPTSSGVQKKVSSTKEIGEMVANYIDGVIEYESAMEE